MSGESEEGKILHVTLYWEERKIIFCFAYSYENKDYEIRDLPSLEPGWFEFEIFEYGVGVTKRTFFKYEDFGASDIGELFDRFAEEPEKVLEKLLGEKVPVKEVIAVDWLSEEDEIASYKEPYYDEGDADYDYDDIYDEEQSYLG